MIEAELVVDGCSHTLEISGHADLGRDTPVPCAQCERCPETWGNLICAAASVLGQSLLCHLKQMEGEVQILREVHGPGRLAVDCVGGAAVTELFALVRTGLRQLAATYPQHVRVNEGAEKGAR